MSDIFDTHPQTESAVRLAIRTLYPVEHFPEAVFPTLLDTVRNSFFNRVSSEEYASSEKSEKILQSVVREYCSIKPMIYNDPNAFILMYFPMITSYVRRCYANHYPDRLEDITQELFLLLQKGGLQTIWENYSRSKKDSQFSAYFVVSIRYKIRDILRRIRRWHTFELEDGGETNVDKHSYDFTLEPVLQTEMARLSKVLKLYHKTRPKLELLLKLKYRLPVEREDVEGWLGNVSEEELSVFQASYVNRTQLTIFTQVLPVINKKEKTDNKPVTLSRWIDNKISESITLMNKMHTAPVYNTNVFMTLVSLYYYKYHLNHKGKKS